MNWKDIQRDEISAGVCDWHYKEKMGMLRTRHYVFHLEPGKTRKEAMRKSARKLRALAKEFDELAKE